MIGKKNIVFGFLYLVLTAALGPYMVLEVIPDVGEAGATKQQSMSELQLMASSGFEKDLEPMDADAIARSNTQALLDLNRMLQSEAHLDQIKGGPHTHGNLESVLNILAGLTLLFLTVPVWWKQAISWAFILGALLHSGMVYLGVVFGQGWALQVLDTGIGPLLVLLGLLLAGIAAAVGFSREPVRDN
ncbi:MAG TPA: hypothetical protein VK971_08495 [Thiohalobacter sp.]|nr:hypothetical protein [Thiohalobacter sp.]